MLIDKERQEGLLVDFVSDSSLCRSESDVPVYPPKVVLVRTSGFVAAVCIFWSVGMWVRFVNFALDECARGTLI